MKAKTKNNNTIIIKGLITLTVFGLQLKATASTNMNNASFTKTWNDYKSSKSPLKIDRTYSSRSLYNGIFGFGWCSNIETSVSFNKSGNITLHNCGHQSEVEFVSLNKPKKQSLSIYSNSARMEFITFSNHVFNLFRTDGSLVRFNKEGQITFVIYSNGSYVEFFYNKQHQLIKIRDNHGKHLKLSYDQISNKVTVILTPRNFKLHYEHHKEDLINVKRHKRIKHRYRYDQLHNMLMAKSANSKSRFKMTYQADRDLLLSVQDGKGCLERYDYISHSIHHHSARINRVCNNKLIKKLSYDFWYSQVERKRYLERFQVTNSQGRRLYHLSPQENSSTASIN